MTMNTFEKKLSDSSFVNPNFPSYNKILIPHDGSEMSDIALRDSIYSSKISNVEWIIINIIEEDIISSSTLLSFIRKEEEGD